MTFVFSSALSGPKLSALYLFDLVLRYNHRLHMHQQAWIPNLHSVSTEYSLSLTLKIEGEKKKDK